MSGKNIVLIVVALALGFAGGGVFFGRSDNVSVNVDRGAGGGANVNVQVGAGDGAPPILLKTPVAFGSHLPALGSPIIFISETLDKVSGGNVKMKFYEPGELVAPFEILDAVSDGKINSGYTTAGYWYGKMKAAALFSAVPFGPEAPEYLAWLFYGNGLKLWQETYDKAGYNVKVMPCTITSPETSGWFKTKMTKPEDFAGLNIRFFGLGGEVMKQMGANPSLLPGGEIFGALEKGQIDATEFSMPAIDERLGFYKIVKNNYFPGWHQQATVYELMINKDVWNGMSAQQQAVVETVCQASLTTSLAESEAAQPPALKRQVEENGVSLEYWNDAMLDAFREGWNKVLEEQLQDPQFARVWEDMSAFRDDYDTWESKAFLPRN